VTRVDRQRIYNTTDFPGWRRFPAFLSSFLSTDKEINILDIGGGANPMMWTIAQPNMLCDLLDIDEKEIAKAGGAYNNVFCIDATVDSETFSNAVGNQRYDVVFSHMFLEHIRRPDNLHKNIHLVLKPGGYSIHAYPTNRNLPLALNTLLPEFISRGLVSRLQATRDLEGRLGKFPAYYRKCFPPSARAERYFNSLGYEVVLHHGYAGHGYYSRIPLLRSLERIHRTAVVAAQIRWIVFSILVLRKPTNAA
jgi:SAM-dependent methyltransferase